MTIPVKKKLDDVCLLISDCPHSTAPDEGEGYPLIRTPNIGKGRFLLDGVHRVSERVYKARNCRATPKDDDIIFAREAPAGNAAIIKNGEKYCLGQRTVLIRPNSEMVYPDYLVYYLLAPEQQHKLLSTAHGATVSHVNIPDIHNMNVDNLPDLPTQHRIASILSAYDDLIENNRRQIKLLEEAAQRLYREWFVELRFPGCEDVKIVDGVPEGWSVGTLADIAEFKRGQAITKDETRVGNVPVVAGGLEPAYYHDTSNTGVPVVTVSGSGANAGFTRMYHTRVWASDCSYIDTTTSNCVAWVYCFLKSKAVSIERMKKGAAQPHVYAKDLNAMKVLLPDDSLLKHFASIVESMFNYISKLDLQTKLLVEARDRLLPKLMSGEMEVDL